MLKIRRRGRSGIQWAKKGPPARYRPSVAIQTRPPAAAAARNHLHCHDLCLDCHDLYLAALQRHVGPYAQKKRSVRLMCRSHLLAQVADLLCYSKPAAIWGTPAAKQLSRQSAAARLSKADCSPSPDRGRAGLWPSCRRGLAREHGQVIVKLRNRKPSFGRVIARREVGKAVATSPHSGGLKQAIPEKRSRVVTPLHGHSAAPGRGDLRVSHGA
jgi:hypothetical protein